MDDSKNNHFSGFVTTFQGRKLPEEAVLTGYAAIIAAYRLQVPLPSRLCAAGAHHRMYEKDGWRIFTLRHTPGADLKSHLIFALKYEGVDLVVLNRLFDAVESENIAEMISSTPTGKYMRRLWFLYEWLTEKKLNLPDLEAGTYVPVLDPDLQWGIQGEHSSRQRVINNLPGTRKFCPLVFRTPGIDEYIAMDLPTRAKEVMGPIPKELLSRTAAFLLLKDSRASYIIEGEAPGSRRIERWGKALGEAGKNHLDKAELHRLQQVVISDTRFVKMGFRDKGGFVGEHDRETGVPIPEHISAHPGDLVSLIEGLIAYIDRCDDALDPVIGAACAAFGFVYIHPFFDGNGRIHRYLFHHILARAGYNPPGLSFPVSAAILKKVDRYGSVLRSYSEKLLPLIQWEATEDHNLRVLNKTDDYYRYFDASPHTEFLFYCVKQTIEEDLPKETRFLQQYDRFRTGIDGMLDMPPNIIHLLFRSLRQGEGRLSNRALKKHFSLLREDEIAEIQELYRELFG